MSRRPVVVALSATLLVAALAMPAAGQGVPPACTQPLDPACNHLKCYQITDKAEHGGQQVAGAADRQPVRA